VRISVELVPRGQEALCAELERIRRNLPQVNTINVPDLLRFDLRSWQGCGFAKPFYPHVIPHIRAIDVPLDRPLAVADFLRQHTIDEVLVIAGDAPPDMSRVVYPSTSLDVLRKFKREMPDIKLYAGLDPYRQSFTRERDYALQKLDAGAAGFFTQPFFDLRLMEIYAELLAPLSSASIFWGVTNVESEKSLSYWQTRNHAVFPAHFEPSLAWNRALAKAALDFARATASNIYYMPIRANVLKYLKGIL
jgi:methylenetetrahydrofolate reductase (NADPH)